MTDDTEAAIQTVREALGGIGVDTEMREQIAALKALDLLASALRETGDEYEALREELRKIVVCVERGGTADTMLRRCRIIAHRALKEQT